MDNKTTGTSTGAGIGNIGTVTGGEDLWILGLKVIAVSPIYTGENKIESQKMRKTGNRLPTRKSGDGYAVVNISGVLRSFVEKIYKDEGSCDVGKNAKGCGRCMTCHMFGSLGRKGRISIDLLKSVLPFDKVVQTTVHPRIDRDTGTIPSERGASIEVEEIQENTELVGRILIRNPEEKDILVLDNVLKAMEVHGIGGWTRRGLGRTKIVTTLEKKKWSDYKEMGKEEVKKLVEDKK